jgi:type VI protein secretion system component Hcp
MLRPSSRFTILLALGAAGAAPALAEPAPPSPVPTPYPNVASQDAAHKHIGNVKYEDFAKSDAATMDSASLELNVEAVAWGGPGQQPVLNSADPMEGGQVTARTYHPGKPTYGNVTMEGVASDPEEGGQVSEAKTRKPTISEMNVTKVNDVSSSNLSSARSEPGEPGKLEYPNLVAEPVAKGTATFKTLAGICATGKHLDKVKIVMRSRSFTLHDATVVSVTPVDAVDGRPMEEVTVAYDGVGD